MDAPNYRTLPSLAVEFPASLDSLRALVRRTPELRALGQRFGATRVFSAGDAAVIRRAWESKKRPVPA